MVTYRFQCERGGRRYQGTQGSILRLLQELRGCTWCRGNLAFPPEVVTLYHAQVQTGELTELPRTATLAGGFRR